MTVSIQDLNYYSALKIVGYELWVMYKKQKIRFWLDPVNVYKVKGCKKPQKLSVLKPGQEIISGEDTFKIISIQPPLKTDVKFQGDKKLKPNTFYATDSLLEQFCQEVCKDNEFNYDKSNKLMRTYGIMSVAFIYVGLMITTIFGDTLYVSGATFDKEDVEPFLLQLNRPEDNTIQDTLISLQAV